MKFLISSLLIACVSGVCIQDVKKCFKKFNGNVSYVSRDETNGCKFHRCPYQKDRFDHDNIVLAIAKKKHYRDKLDAAVDDLETLFYNDTDYVSMTKDERKTLKRTIFQEYKGKKLKLRRNMTEGDFDNGGVKFYKGFIKDVRVNFISEKEYDDDSPIIINSTDNIMFEEYAHFKLNGRTFFCNTTKRTAAEGHHFTSFRDLNTQEKCYIDGATNETECYLETASFKIFMIGSTVAEVTEEGTINTASTPTAAPLDDDESSGITVGGVFGGLFFLIILGLMCFTKTGRACLSASAEVLGACISSGGIGGRHKYAGVEEYPVLGN